MRESCRQATKQKRYGNCSKSFCASSHNGDAPADEDPEDSPHGTASTPQLPRAAAEDRSRSPPQNRNQEGYRADHEVAAKFCGLSDVTDASCLRRAVATSCRASVLPRSTAAALDLGEPLRTLLEGIHTAPCNLWDRLVPLHDVQCGSPRPHVHDTVEAVGAVESLSLGSLRCPFTVDDIRAVLCCPAVLDSMHQALGLCKLADKVWFLQRQHDMQLHQASDLLCYTDGSYVPPTADAPPCLGWACAFFQPSLSDDAFEACLGIASGSIPDWVGVDQKPSAYMAECLALSFGAWLSARNFPGRDVTFLSDCVAALGVAEATTGYDSFDFAGTTQGLHLLRRASSGGNVLYTHTPGHNDIFSNELVDVVAKLAAKGSSLGSVGLPPATRWFAKGAPLLPWFAAACRSLRGMASWPSMDGTPVGPLAAPTLPPDRLLEPFLPVALHGRGGTASVNAGPESRPKPEDCSRGDVPFLRIRLASYKALSLLAPDKRQQLHTEGIAFRVARPALLAQCLDEAMIDIAAVQETRCAAGTLTTGPYYRICSSADGGMFGRFRVGKPVLRIGRRTVCLQAHLMMVHHASPRRLLVSFEPGHTKLFLLAVHAPHRGAEAHAIASWWEETIRICREIVNDHDCIIAGDMNASVGTVCTHRAGDFAAEEEDLAGSFFRQLVQERGTWAPATFRHLHSGQSWTYGQKRNGRLIRPDYISLPDSWWWGHVESQVAPGIHAGQPAPDHYAVVVQVHVRLKSRGLCTAATRNQGRGRRFDTDAMAQPANRETVASIICILPYVSWEVSALCAYPCMPAD